MSIKITTNNQPRALICWQDLTEEEQANFPYILLDIEECQKSNRVQWRLLRQTFVRAYGRVFNTADCEFIKLVGDGAALKGPFVNGDLRVQQASPLAKWGGLWWIDDFSGVVFKAAPPKFLDSQVFIGKFTLEGENS